MNWTEKTPGRVELRGPGQKLPNTPLEPVLASGRCKPSAAAGNARELTPASPDPEEAYCPPEDAGEWWNRESKRAMDEFLSQESLAKRLSPLATPPLLSVPTGDGEEVEDLIPTREETPPFTFPESPVGVVGLPAVQLPTVANREAVDLAAARADTPTSALAGRMKPSDMIGEAATVSLILTEPDLTDILQVPDLSLFLPPIPIREVKSEPVDIVEIPDSPPRASVPLPDAPFDYRKAYEELRQHTMGYVTQLHFWAETVGTLGAECPRVPTLQEQARRRQLLASGLWPNWMTGIVDESFAELGNRFQVYYGALLHDGGPRF